MQKTILQKIAPWILIVMGVVQSPVSAFNTTTGFEDKLKAFPEKLVKDADASIKNLSKSIGVPILFVVSNEIPSGELNSTLLVQIQLNDQIRAHVYAGSSILSSGKFKEEDVKRLERSMNANIKEGLPDSAIYSGIQFIKNTFISKSAIEASTSQSWEPTVLAFLVGLFLLLSVLIFFVEGKSVNSGSSYHHLF